MPQHLFVDVIRMDVDAVYAAPKISSIMRVVMAVLVLLGVFPRPLGLWSWSPSLEDAIFNKFIEPCMNVTASTSVELFASGAENSVFRFTQCPHLIARLAFFHSGSCPLKVETYYLGLFVNDANFSKLPLSASTTVLRDGFEQMRQKVVPILPGRMLAEIFSRPPVRDIYFTLANVEQRFNGALASGSSGLVYSVIAPLASTTAACFTSSSGNFSELAELLMPNPGSSSQRCRFVPPLCVTIELHHRWDSSVDMLVKSDLTLVDFAVLLLGYLHDCIQMYLQHGWWPYDSHPGNVFVNRTRGGDLIFAWADFGHSHGDNYKERQADQIETSMTKMRQKLQSLATGDGRKQTLVETWELAPRHVYGEPEKLMGEEYQQRQLARIELAIHTYLNTSEYASFTRRVGSTTRSTLMRMQTELATHKTELTSHKVELAIYRSTNEEIKAELAIQRSTNEEIEAEFKAELAIQRSTNEEIKAGVIAELAIQRSTNEEIKAELAMTNEKLERLMTNQGSELEKIKILVQGISFSPIPSNFTALS